IRAMYDYPWKNVRYYNVTWGPVNSGQRLTIFDYKNPKLQQLPVDGDLISLIDLRNIEYRKWQPCW
ncbi:hypothetical protein MKW98_032058, partial [Papaver atlanticum]